MEEKSESNDISHQAATLSVRTQAVSEIFLFIFEESYSDE